MVRIPKDSKKFLRWFIKNYGYGGMENYTIDQCQKVFRGLSDILEASSLRELEFIGKTLLQISERNEIYLNDVLESISEEVLK